MRRAPALAVGGYNFGTKSGATTQNIGYALIAKTLPKTSSFPSLGRFSVGYYRGSKRVLVDVRYFRHRSVPGQDHAVLANI